ncbi:MAG: DUF2281 domain-containing protein [Potamolinea sp.]
MSIEQIVLAKLRTLPPEKQQEVLDFVEFLQTKTVGGEKYLQDGEQVKSFLTLAQEVIGFVEGPSDLSTNKSYLEGYGS